MKNKQHTKTKIAIKRGQQARERRKKILRQKLELQSVKKRAQMNISALLRQLPQAQRAQAAKRAGLFDRAKDAMNNVMR